jgi:hypothetical protein
MANSNNIQASDEWLSNIAQTNHQSHPFLFHRVLDIISKHRQ